MCHYRLDHGMKVCIIIHSIYVWPTLSCAVVYSNSMFFCSSSIMLITSDHFISSNDWNACTTITLMCVATKLYHKANSEQDCITVQGDHNKLVDWSEKWQMNCNVDKCTNMHIGTPKKFWLCNDRGAND